MADTLAGSVIIIFRPGFFFGFDSISSDPDSIAWKFVESADISTGDVIRRTPPLGIAVCHIVIERMLFSLMRRK
jgi:hypothetical protein